MNSWRPDYFAAFEKVHWHLGQISSFCFNHYKGWCRNKQQTPSLSNQLQLCPHTNPSWGLGITSEKLWRKIWKWPVRVGGYFGPNLCSAHKNLVSILRPDCIQRKYEVSSCCCDFEKNRGRNQAPLKRWALPTGCLSSGIKLNCRVTEKRSWLSQKHRERAKLVKLKWKTRD